MLLDVLNLPLSGQRPHLHRVIQRRPDLQRARALRQPAEESLGDRFVHVDPLDRNADLARRREASLDRAIHRRLQIGIRQHDHGILAAEFERAPDQPLRRLPRHQPAGARAAREHHVIRALAQRRPEQRAFARDHAEYVRRKTRLAQQVHRPERRETGLHIRFEHRGVARHQRRHRVGHRQVERIIPRDDEADHAHRRLEFPGPGQQRQGALAPARTQQSLRPPRVVARDDRGVQNLFECVPPRLAGFPLDEIQHFVLALQQQIVKAQKDARAVGKRAPAPGRLRGPRALHGKFQIRRGPRRDGADLCARVGRAYRNRLVWPVGQSDLRDAAVEQRAAAGEASGRR